MDAMQEFAEALAQGDYVGALSAYRTTEHARSEVGAATEALLMALVGDHAGAARQLAGCQHAELIEAIVRGERERTARWTDVGAAGELAAIASLPYLGVYAGMGVALLAGDERTIAEQLGPEARAIPPVAGRLVRHDGTAIEFGTIHDSDDGIGVMLETYGPSGLLYLPFAVLRRVQFLPPRNFIDRLVPRATVELVDGRTTTVLVPLLYALSTTADSDEIRAGRMTTWRHVGGARRALGQRDFVLDGGRMIGMQQVAALELRT